MADSDFDVLEPILTRQDDVLELLNDALRKAGLHDLHIRRIHLDIAKRGPVGPPDKIAEWKCVRQLDGSVVCGWVWK